MSGSFVHLHLHSEFSLVDSTVRVKPLMAACREAGMPAVALTDQNNLFGMVKFFRAALQNGIKPIIGADIRVANRDDPGRPFTLILLCMDRNGYGNLSRLLTRAYAEGRERGDVLVAPEWLDEAACTGLIALSGGLHGDVGQALATGHDALARARAEHWQAVFPERFYLELVRTGRAAEEGVIAATLTLAAGAGLPVVASNDVRFLAADDFEAHEARVCIHDGRGLADPDRPRHYSPQQYLRSPDEMAALFADVPSAIGNSVEIARRCNLQLTLGKSVLPAFPTPGGQDEGSFLEAEARRGLDAALARRFADESTPPGERDAISAPYRARLETELDVIRGMGFPGYFLIVADFIRWARDNDVPVGPGRGSGAGSVVAWVLGITDLDPLQHDLLFERFLNPERVSMPDFDIDFCMEGRDRVIDYVAERYGRDRVAQIITFGTMAARAVIRDTGRILGHPYGFVDRIAKQVPFEVGMTLEKALADSDELAAMVRDDEEVAAILDLAQALEGLARNAGKHAGGVVIAPSALTDFTPLYCEDGGGLVTQLDKDDVEAIGLVKFDFLGLKTLTIIDWAVDIVNAERAGEPLDIHAIPMDDAATFRLLQQRRTAAVFQLESSGMKDLIKRMRPDQFDDLVALVALFRPGPLQSGMVDDFIARKHATNQTEIDYLHPDLQPVLEETYGVILYQEQVMQIAQVLAGYTLGGADLLRRAMGKKKPAEMAKQREIFVSGATERGVQLATATRIFDLMEKFAGYGFNKSHSAAYAVLSYQTAYLKAHYPEAFMAAVMSADLDNTDRLVTLKDDCRALGIELQVPSINASGYYFSVAGPGAIRYGLGAIKSVGRSAVENVVGERERHGPFADLASFCRRVDGNRVNRRAVEAMIRAGALDDFGRTRRALLADLDEAMKSADQEARAAAAGQNDMFGLEAPARNEPASGPAGTELPEWPERERLRHEKDALGLYLTGHPFHSVSADARHFVDGGLGELAAEPAPQSVSGAREYRQPTRDVTVAGLVTDLRRRGTRFSVTLDDDTGRMELSLFAEAFQEFRELLVKDTVVVVSGGLRYDDFSGAWTVNVKSVVPIEQVIETRQKGMLLKLAPNGGGEQLLARLHDALLPYRDGPCEVAIEYVGKGASVRLQLGPEWSVRPSLELRGKLHELLGGGNVRPLYPLTREIM